MPSSKQGIGGSWASGRVSHCPCHPSPSPSFCICDVATRPHGVVVDVSILSRLCLIPCDARPATEVTAFPAVAKHHPIYLSSLDQPVISTFHAHPLLELVFRCICCPSHP